MMAARDPFGNLTGLAALSEIGRRLGDLGAQVKDAVNASQTGGAAGERQFTIETADGPVRGVTQSSFRVRTLADAAGRSAPRRSGGMAGRAERTRPQAPDVDGAREPMVDCFDEGDAVLVTAELPGVLAGEISLSVEAGVLTIETTGARRYRARQPLPAPVDAGSLSHEFRNGILEARIAKAGAAS
ncbi:MAG: Hsp20/alpha crystallin family protein [Beijerinckiaceae bacterium]